MRTLKFGIILLSVVVLVTSAPVALAAGRVALVVGNSAYSAIGALPNPGNDAADVAAALGRLGFDVTTVRDVDRVAMSEALRVFTRESAGADVALVFYAGHGLEMDGVNYLVPVDAQLERDTDVRFEAIELDDVLAATVGAELRVVILDACRNNPLARLMQRTAATRSVSRGSFGELDENLLGDETLVAYAAAAGTTAADGTGRNSPYTAALLEYLEQPLEIGILFREVRARVLEATGGDQRPHEYASLLAEHYLSAASAPAGPLTTVDGSSAAAMLAHQETVFWQSIANSEDPADFQAYLGQFPNGVYARLATNRLAVLRPSPASGPSANLPSDPPSPPPVSRPTVTEDAPQTAEELSAFLGRDVSRFWGDENGWTDLHYAAALNLPHVVSDLVNEGANVNARIRDDGNRLSRRLIRELRTLGHDFDQWTRDGETPLHIAAFVGAREVAVQLLASGADSEAGTKFDWRPLHYAAVANAHGVVEALLEHGAEVQPVTDEVDQPGRTPLRLALQGGSREVAAALQAGGATR